MEYLQIPDSESYALVSEIVEKTFDELKDSKEIIGGYCVLDCLEVNVREGIVACSAGYLHTGRKLSGYMKGSGRIALFLCTAGKTFTGLSHAYQQNGDFLEAFVVESIGSATVENAMDKVQQYLEEEMTEQKEDHEPLQSGLLRMGIVRAARSVCLYRRPPDRDYYQ